MAKKATVNQGFTDQIKAKGPQKIDKPKKPFSYSKPVNKPDKINSMAINSRTREFRSVKQDKTTNFAVEQNSAKQSHKGNK